MSFESERIIDLAVRAEIMQWDASRYIEQGKRAIDLMKRIEGKSDSVHQEQSQTLARLTQDLTIVRTYSN